MPVLEFIIALPIGAVIGWIIREIVSDRLARDRAIDLYQVTEFNKAATRFQLAFYNELIFLKHNAIVGKMGSTDNLGECLFSGYVHRHLKAFEIFRNHLSVEDRAGIDKAWQKYCKHTDKPEMLYFEQYSTKNVSKEREKELKDLALENIEGILKFAKHK